MLLLRLRSLILASTFARRFVLVLMLAAMYDPNAKYAPDDQLSSKEDTLSSMQDALLLLALPADQPRGYFQLVWGGRAWLQGCVWADGPSLETLH